ncbi:MAG: hypothetical protein ACKPKO_11610, partial [Candidatus Fonsibacter sp.]
EHTTTKWAIEGQTQNHDKHQYEYDFDQDSGLCQPYGNDVTSTCYATTQAKSNQLCSAITDKYMLVKADIAQILVKT